MITGNKESFCTKKALFEQVCVFFDKTRCLVFLTINNLQNVGKTNC